MVSLKLTPDAVSQTQVSGFQISDFDFDIPDLHSPDFSRQKKNDIN